MNKKKFKSFRESPNGAPRDFETIVRSFKRKLIGLDSGSSEPLISGDSFKFRAQFIFDGFFELKDVDLHEFHNSETLIFAQAGPMSNAVINFVHACKIGMSFQKANLIIHNGDILPNQSDMLVLAENFKSVSSVNWLGDRKIIHPLPIGLENRDKRRNGVPSDFIKEIKRGLPESVKRDIELLVCFSSNTNPDEREIALELGKNITGAYIIKQPITPKSYRKLLLRSKFVLSPPGNGPDCHRTWESMYLGAIPIVKRSFWPFSHLQLPVLVLDDWNDLELFRSFNLGNVDLNWKKLDFWLNSQ
jgi:hypothetical protein